MHKIFEGNKQQLPAAILIGTVIPVNNGYETHSQKRKYSDLNIVREYVDDGKTGTDFSRPAFSRMMADLKAGLINCVIVKDLSRFGREYIEAGNYIEKVFPFLGVRFISIVDRYDSAHCLNISCTMGAVCLQMT